MEKTKKTRLLALLLLLALVCSACSQSVETTTESTEPTTESTDPQPTYEYTEVYRRVPQPYASSFAYTGNMHQTTANARTYEFAVSISEEDCSAFVLSQEALCEYLEENGVSTDGLTFCVLEDYPVRADSENQTAYFGLQAEGTWEQVLVTLQASMGDYANYGYLYALSNRIADELELRSDDEPTANEAVFAEDPTLLNLVYPCFSEKYANASSIPASKALALALLESAENIWSEVDFLEARQTYAESVGIDFEPTELTFAYNGENCPLKLKCQYMEVFWDDTFVANIEYTDGYIPVDYTQGVAGLIHTFEWLDEQLAVLCERLGAEPQTCVSVQMSESLPRWYSSEYFENGGLYVNETEEGQIYATTVTVLAHEYVHHLYWLLCGASDADYSQWCNEAVAYYYTVAECFERDINIMRYVDPSYAGNLALAIGEPYDEPSDYIKLVRILLRENGYEYRDYATGLKGNYQLASCFGEYFVRTYGEESFLNSMLYPSRVAEFTEKGMDEIIDDWIVDMKDPEND